MADADNRIVYANPAVTLLFGWDPIDLVDQEVAVLVPERLRAMHSTGFDRYRRTGIRHIMGQPTRVPAVTRDGEERLIELILSPVPLGPDRTGIAATLRNVDDRVDLERQSAVASHLLTVFARGLDEDELINAVLEALGRSLEMAAAAFWVPSEGGRDLLCSAFWPKSAGREELEAASRTTRLGRGEGLPGRVWASGAATWISSLAEDHDYPRRRHALADGLSSAFAFPVRAGGLTPGIVELYTTEPTERDEKPARAVIADRSTTRRGDAPRVDRPARVADIDPGAALRQLRGPHLVVQLLWVNRLLVVGGPAVCELGRGEVAQR